MYSIKYVTKVFCFSMKAFTSMWNVVVSLLCIYCYSYYSRDFHICCKRLFRCARGCTPITCMCTANCIDDSEHYNVGKLLLTITIGLAYTCNAHWLGFYENKVHWKNCMVINWQKVKFYTININVYIKACKEA